MKIEELRELLVKCWKDGSSKGQCYVTALIVQDFFGGDLLRFKEYPLERSHYWNLLPDGCEVDLTSDQFGGDGFSPVFHITDYHPHIFTREQKLYPYYPTVVRYAELMLKLSKMLDKYTQFCAICGRGWANKLWICPKCKRKVCGHCMLAPYTGKPIKEENFLCEDCALKEADKK